MLYKYNQAYLEIDEAADREFGERTTELNGHPFERLVELQRPVFGGKKITRW